MLVLRFHYAKERLRFANLAGPDTAPASLSSLINFHGAADLIFCTHESTSAMPFAPWRNM